MAPSGRVPGRPQGSLGQQPPGARESDRPEPQVRSTLHTALPACIFPRARPSRPLPFVNSTFGTPHHTTQHNTTQHNTTQQNATQHNTAQHSRTQHSTAQHSTAQHSTAQHNTTQHNTTPTQHNTTQHNTTQHNTTQHNITQHNTTQHNTTQHNTTQHNTTQHNTTQHNTTQHNTTQHNTTQHNTTQHNTTQHNTIYFEKPNINSITNANPQRKHACSVLNETPNLSDASVSDDGCKYPGYASGATYLSVFQQQTDRLLMHQSFPVAQLIET